MMIVPKDVTDFWVNEVGPEGWYRQDNKLDQTIRDRFLGIWLQCAATDCEGSELDQWIETPEALLALLIVLDQFPRNMFRGDPRSFATDPRARAVAKKAIDKGWDKRIATPERQFFYLPLMHSECLADQDRAVRMIKTRMEDHANLLHAKAHREIIRRFGRFPYRNDVLSRKTTDEEAVFLAEGGYGAMVKEFQAVAA